MSNMNNTSSSRTIVIYEEDQYNEEIYEPIDHEQQPSSQDTSKVDLELRLGLGASIRKSVKRVRKIKDPNPKKDEAEIESCSQAKSIPKEAKLICAICLDTMKVESCTRCGHIFCRECIISALVKSAIAEGHGKCPTCNTKVSMRSIRRLYLPAIDL